MKWQEKCAYATCVLAAMSMIAVSVWARATHREPGLPPEAKTEIKIDNFAFSPETLTVPVGTTVQWTNRDDIPHTVVSDDKTTFKSKALDTDDKFSFTFTKAGTYPYFCSVHPKMTGKVVVQ
jgi:plastocyanin